MKASGGILSVPASPVDSKYQADASIAWHFCARLTSDCSDEPRKSIPGLTLARAHRIVDTILEAVAIVVIAIATIRFGLLASAVMLFVAELLQRAPMTFDVGHWCAAANWTVAIVPGLTMFGFYAARAGQALFASDDASPHQRSDSSRSSDS